MLPALALALVGLVLLAWLFNINPYPSSSPSLIALARPLTVTVTIIVSVTNHYPNPRPNQVSLASSCRIARRLESCCSETCHTPLERTGILGRTKARVQYCKAVIRYIQ